MIIDLDRAPASTPPPRARRLRPAAALVLALALLLGPDHPQRPVPPLERVATTEKATGTWELTEDTLYSTRPLENGRVDILAQDLDTGRLRWRRQAEWLGRRPVLAVSGSVVVIGVDTGGAVIVADARTGADAVTNLELALPAGDGLLLWDRDARLGFRDAASGEVAWWRTVHRAPASAAADERHLVVLEDTGGAVTLRRSDGRVVGRTDQASPLGEQSQIRIIGDRAYLYGDRAVTALHLPDLTEVWSVPSTLPKHVEPCGTRVCVTGGSGLHALDPEDGSVTWTDVHWAAWVDGLALRIDGQVAVLDPETGAVRAGLGPGFPLGDLLLRPSGDGLHLIDWHTGETRGVLPGALSSACRRSHRHLACQQPNGMLQVWRLP
ncbi:PQQ-binding-like beta-propeller repeat protein [Actinoplanes sp. NPDC049802]|uniref:outer membrane protein assembly factor BamB family protein n=1 Tax=Actinoplanes sp. NPDC049802 TaxID=3154742 RepID=UPI0033CF2D48